ncbi:hypothetical protein [Flavobacterium tructae]|uniref:hypothetical protein n=1 Tax=Flavobacterium tructae TaxID=1114873 RepID=UPI0035A8F56D
MNIDLRNVSENFENNVNQLKNEFEISTNSKAVEYATVNYLGKLKQIERLEKELRDTRLELSEIKKDVKTLTGVLTRLNQIT